ncbi:unnamed protein product [Nesidiocoris tenuis]|uniref:Uncharacterized protein n=1 Tax=Nesidiocoris tenuis TaxID=355587 RepID=A0A6H5HL20_9HEMI|nr:unnamed protein product [Nesidiocoris tenuis]
MRWIIYEGVKHCYVRAIKSQTAFSPRRFSLFTLPGINGAIIHGSSSLRLLSAGILAGSSFLKASFLAKASDT